jgi:lysyl-tRNA synthetase class 1
MDWATNSRPGQRAAGRQRLEDAVGTVHVGSLRGPVILDVIARALRANGHETTLLYGVDDLDPMDAQALLTPDAIEREMGRRWRTSRTRRRLPRSYARHFAACFIDTFAARRSTRTATTG